jgi:hypothetical protein
MIIHKGNSLRNNFSQVLDAPKSSLTAGIIRKRKSEQKKAQTP